MATGLPQEGQKVLSGGIWAPHFVQKVVKGLSFESTSSRTCKLPGEVWAGGMLFGGLKYFQHPDLIVESSGAGIASDAVSVLEDAGSSQPKMIDLRRGVIGSVNWNSRLVVERWDASRGGGFYTERL